MNFRGGNLYMGSIIGIVFWLFIAIKVGNAIGKGVDGELRIMKEKSYDRKEQQIAKKYDATGYPRAIVAAWKQGPRMYKQYVDEVNILRRQYGKREIEFNIPDNYS